MQHIYPAKYALTSEIFVLSTIRNTAIILIQQDLAIKKGTPIWCAFLYH